MQTFPVHFMYNYLMDYYHNELTVEKQMSEAKKILEEGQEFTRDIYKRFSVNTREDKL